MQAAIIFGWAFACEEDVATLSGQRVVCIHLLIASLVVYGLVGAVSGRDSGMESMSTIIHSFDTSGDPGTQHSSPAVTLSIHPTLGTATLS
jgi:hypothetical protein